MKDIRKHNQLASRIRTIRQTLASIEQDLKRIERDLSDDKVTIKGRPGEDGQTVGQRIVNTRKARGMSQRDLARRAGMMPPQLSKIEHDMNDLGSKTARRIAVALDVQLSWLLCGVGNLNAPRRSRDRRGDLELKRERPVTAH